MATTATWPSNLLGGFVTATASSSARSYTSLPVFSNLMLLERKRSKLLIHWLDVFLSVTQKKWVDLQLVGSSFIKERNWKAFYPTFENLLFSASKKLLDKSDFDVAIKLDSFILETLSRIFPNFNKKESEEYGREYGQEGLLKVVYTLPVRDLYLWDVNLFKDLVDADTNSDWSSTRHISTEECLQDGFLDRKIEFLFVTDLDRVRHLWNHIPAELFATKLWKKSNTFIGHDELKTYFTLFEQLVSYRDLPKKVLSKKTPEPVFGDVVAAPQPVWVENVVGGNNAVQALDNLAPAANLVFVDEFFDEPNMAGEAF